MKSDVLRFKAAPSKTSRRGPPVLRRSANVRACAEEFAKPVCASLQSLWFGRKYRNQFGCLRPQAGASFATAFNTSPHRKASAKCRFRKEVAPWRHFIQFSRAWHPLVSASSAASRASACIQCWLTTRSTGRATAGRLGPVGATRIMFANRAKAPCLRAPVSSNVRRQVQQRYFTSAAPWRSHPHFSRCQDFPCESPKCFVR